MSDLGVTRLIATILLASSSLVGCSKPAVTGPPACGSGKYSWHALLPGPGETGHDVALDQLAKLYDRQFHLVNAATTGVTADVQIPADDAPIADLTRFIRDGDGTFPTSRVLSFGKTAGLYAGAGVAADAFRYATLRDQGAACADIETARADLKRGLEATHLASELTGVPGVIARGFIRKDFPGAEAIVPVPLFDSGGQPLPTEKNNGTWREDRSGRHPEYLWEDSCSRDMYLGWALALAVGWEVIHDDPTLPADLKQSLRTDAVAMARELMKVRPTGYDLEIPDADGRTTFHGYINENNLDRAYIPGVGNGFYALMTLGIVGALNSVAGDAAVKAYLNDKLLGERDLATLVHDSLTLVFVGRETNGSNVNMAFTSMWLALHYIEPKASHALLATTLRDQLYEPAGTVWRPVDLGQSLFDFTFSAETGDAAATARGVLTLREFPTPPYRGLTRIQCDDTELDSGMCTLDDGSTVRIAGQGRGDQAVAETPLPMRLRPPSNYWWRSDPYSVNGTGDPGALNSGVDFRFAYWMGRWSRAP